MKSRKKIRHLCIDASSKNSEGDYGIQAYQKQLLLALRPLLEEEVKKGKLKVSVLSGKGSPEVSKSWQKKLRLRFIPFYLRVSLWLFWNKSDLFLSASGRLPFFAPKRSVVIMHDLGYLRFPALYGSFRSFVLDWHSLRVLKKSFKVLVPTVALEHDLKRVYGPHSKKTDVVPHGRMPLSRITEDQRKHALEWYGLQEKAPLFFFIGRLENEKNLLPLLDAFALLLEEHPSAQLFIGGMLGHGFKRLFKRLEKDDLSNVVIAPGPMTVEEVSGIFQSGTALILPSLSAGFGLPVLQSFEARCSLICTDSPSLREIAKDAALYAKAGQASSILKQMKWLLEEKDLQKKKADLGLKRLKAYSWGNAAKTILSHLVPPR